MYLNHPSWWDPVICLFFQRRFFAERTHYAVFEEAALSNYAFFRRMGAIGVDKSAPGSVRNFLRLGRKITASNTAALWVTPQGAFTDPRRRLVQLEKGIAQLAAGAEPFDYLPMAIEYPFWEEKHPEALVAFGEPIGSDSIGSGASCELSASLASLQNELAEAAIGRNAEQFEVLESGRYGVGGVYDWWRQLKGWLQGRPASIRHGEAPQ